NLVKVVNLVQRTNHGARTKNHLIKDQNLVVRKIKITMESTITLQSIISCPHCGFQKEETMPTDACQYFYQCESCKTTFKPKQGDCCVYCSYGNLACPPIQENRSCCS